MGVVILGYVESGVPVDCSQLRLRSSTGGGFTSSDVSVSSVELKFVSTTVVGVTSEALASRGVPID